MNCICNRLVNRRSKSPRSSMLFALVGFAALGLSACKKPEGGLAQADVDLVEPRISLPVERVITDIEGRQLHVSIVRRTRTHISLIRIKDEKAFDLEIEKLSEVDREYAGKLPVSVVIDRPPPDPFVESRQATINKLQNEQDRYIDELTSGSLNSSQQSMVKGKVERIKKEIMGLQGQIEERKN